MVIPWFASLELRIYVSEGPRKRRRPSETSAVPKFARPPFQSTRVRSHTCADTVTHIRRNKSERQAGVALRVDVSESLGMEGYKCSLAQRKWGEEEEEWYGLTGVAMVTLLLKAGRVSEEVCSRREWCHPEATRRTARTPLPLSFFQNLD